ncbi:MAG: 4Fe-4S dicluster domain-containing protein [Planctomycetota bacterium]
MTSRMLHSAASSLERIFPHIQRRSYLRPPGAISERDFLTTCLRCGACLDACPVVAIFPLSAEAGDAVGTPVIDANKAACVVCDGLQCTHVCPSGALIPLLDPKVIRMGLAVVDETYCKRSLGEPCTICVDRCPVGPSAIAFPNDGPPTVLAAGCVGCGVCQLYCPTSPKAIVVEPNQES